MEAYLAKHTGPISFYGKVVDENEQPVEGAIAMFSEALTTVPTNVTSDAQGLFAFIGAKGRHLNVSVSKQGYYGIRTSSVALDFSPTAHPQAGQPDPGRPFVFRLRKRGPGTDLITSQYGVSPDFAVQAPRDGTPVSVDLFGAEGRCKEPDATV